MVQANTILDAAVFSSFLDAVSFFKVSDIYVEDSKLVFDNVYSGMITLPISNVRFGLVSERQLKILSLLSKKSDYVVLSEPTLESYQFEFIKNEITVATFNTTEGYIVTDRAKILEEFSSFNPIVEAEIDSELLVKVLELFQDSTDLKIDREDDKLHITANGSSDSTTLKLTGNILKDSNELQFPRYLISNLKLKPKFETKILLNNTHVLFQQINDRGIEIKILLNTFSDENINQIDNLEIEF